MLGYKVFGAGFSIPAIEAVCKDVTTGISAAGTNQATATELTSAVNFVSTVTADTGVVLDSDGSAGDSQLIYNGGANPLRVYPPTGAAINGLPANTAAIIPINTAVQFFCGSSTQWTAILSK